MPKTPPPEPSPITPAAPLLDSRARQEEEIALSRAEELKRELAEAEAAAKAAAERRAERDKAEVAFVEGLNAILERFQSGADELMRRKASTPAEWRELALEVSQHVRDCQRAVAEFGTSHGGEMTANRARTALHRALGEHPIGAAVNWLQPMMPQR